MLSCAALQTMLQSRGSQVRLGHRCQRAVTGSSEGRRSCNRTARIVSRGCRRGGRGAGCRQRVGPAAALRAGARPPVARSVFLNVSLIVFDQRRAVGGSVLASAVQRTHPRLAFRQRCSAAVISGNSVKLGFSFPLCPTKDVTSIGRVAHSCVALSHRPSLRP